MSDDDFAKEKPKKGLFALSFMVRGLGKVLNVPASGILIEKSSKSVGLLNVSCIQAL